MKKFLVLICLLISTHIVLADGGMWIPLLLKKYNIDDMHKAGLKLSAEDIYSINHSSLKDAIVQFGGGCTGELISDDGLLITNHHCGYGQIQQHSSVEHDYLTDGFWAANRSEELPNEGLTVSFLYMIDDVTSRVLNQVTSDDTETARRSKIQKAIGKIQKQISDTSHYESEIKPFYNGNQYYLFVYEVFKDVRLVGAPPSSIGKFGGDTDNWVWPRHTGDFSMFRIYADKNNKPAEYSEDNVPYHPKKSLTINIGGVKANDFTMVYGYPGSTQEYLYSDAVKYIVEQRNPAKIKMRDTKLAIMKKHMDASDKVRIQLSSKYAGVANGWKKWIGESKGLNQVNAVKIKKDLESNIQEWIKKDAQRNKKYGNLLDNYKKYYAEINDYQLAREYVIEAIFGVEAINFASSFAPYSNGKKKIDKKAVQKRINHFYKDYDVATDKEVMTALLSIYYKDQPENFQPKFFREIEKKYKGKIAKFVDKVYAKSLFVNKEKAENFFLHHFSESKLLKDPIFKLYRSTIKYYTNTLLPRLSASNEQKSKMDRDYMKILMDYSKDTVLFPDANFTLRVAYGKVQGYKPRDGVIYNYYTTLSGMMEKEKLGMHDYVIAPKLKSLYEKKDFGDYAENGAMPVCFIASNHTTGGNSGSPVLNDKGELIGVNFDRCWEGTMSDIMFDSEICRNIVLDIRYALFVIDKYAGASYLLDEMKIVK